jgi:hypothetical protein
MFLLTIMGREREGAYSVMNEYGEKILYLFEEEDDAERYAMMLEEDGHPEMHLIEIENDIMLQTCNLNDYKYTVITSNDIVIPPNY